MKDINNSNNELNKLYFRKFNYYKERTNKILNLNDIRTIGNEGNVIKQFENLNINENNLSNNNDKD